MGRKLLKGRVRLGGVLGVMLGLLSGVFCPRILSQLLPVEEFKAAR